MPTLSEYFEAEARELLASLDSALRGAPTPDAAELHRAARALRGAAQMARETPAYRVAGALEIGVRAVVSGRLPWSPELADRIRASLADLHALVGGTDEDPDARVAAAVRRWTESGVQLPPQIAGDEAHDEGATPASAEFREYAAREVAGIADALDTGVEQLSDEPLNREPLRAILRRQRALLGAARLDELPVVAEILRALEDLTRVIAKLDIPVKREWLDIYRVAREALRSAVGPLERNEDPQPTHALSRLRHMREELLERYGAGEAVSAAHETAGLVQATHAVEPPEPPALSDVEPPAPAPAPGAATSSAAAGDDAAESPAELVLLEEADETAGEARTGSAHPSAGEAAEAEAVSVDQLLYDRDAALRRVLELRDAIYAAVAADPDARAAADELFDLVRIALG